MFSGLVWASVPITMKQSRAGGGVDLEVSFADPRAQDWKLGDSVAINGVCLTIVKSSNTKFLFEVSPETLSCTALAKLNVDDFVHIEPAMSLGDRIGGHLVSGHVDTIAPLSKMENQGDFWCLEWKLKGESRKKIAPYLVPKGSIAVNGVSLTVNQVKDIDTELTNETFFDVMLIPHTLKVTTLGTLKIGELVNLEADMMAKYASRASRFYDQ
jgi:riboflavin synthase